MITIIGFIAAILTTSAFIPQALKTIKTKDTSGISLLMYILFTIGIFGWFIYGILITDYALILANGIASVFSSTILYYKIRNVRNHMDQ
jgi:MtN3 and saliva related transmembrane protein